MQRAGDAPPRRRLGTWGQGVQKTDRGVLVAFAALLVPVTHAVLSVGLTMLDAALETTTAAKLIWLSVPLGLAIAWQLTWCIAFLQHREERRAAAILARRLERGEQPLPTRPTRPTAVQTFVDAGLGAVAFVSAFALVACSSGHVLSESLGLSTAVVLGVAVSAGAGGMVLLYHMDRLAGAMPRWRAARSWMRGDWETSAPLRPVSAPEPSR